MLVRDVATVDGLLAILEQPTSEMQALRERLTIDGRFPTRRTWERRLNALPGHVAGPHRLSGRLSGDTARSVGWLWASRRHRQHDPARPRRRLAQERTGRRAKCPTRPPSIPRAHWTKSGCTGGADGWKLHLVTTVAAVWIPLAAELTPANAADNETAPRLLARACHQPFASSWATPAYQDPGSSRRSAPPPTASWWRPAVAAYPHTDDGVEVRRVFHKLRSLAIENFNEPVQRHLRCARLRPDARPRPHPALRTRGRLRLPVDLAPSLRASARISASASKPS